MKGVLYIAALFYCLSSTAQQPTQADKKKDSLLSVLSTTKSDTTKTNTLLGLSSHYISLSRYDTALDYARRAAIIAEQGSVDTLTVKTWHNLCLIYYTLMKNDSGLYYAEKGITLSEKNKAKKGLGVSYYWKAYGLATIEKYSESVKYAFIGLKLFEEIKFYERIASVYELLSWVTLELGKESESLEYGIKALHTWKLVGNDIKITHVSTGVGSGYCIVGDYSKARLYFDTAQAGLGRLGTRAPVWGEAYTNNCIGDMYSSWSGSAAADKLAAGRYRDSAIKYLTRSLEQWELIEKNKTFPSAPLAVKSVHVRLAKMYLYSGKISPAKMHLEKGKNDTGVTSDRDNMANFYYVSSLIDSAEGRYKEAFSNFRLYQANKDSIQSMEALRKAEIYKNEYLFDKKEKELELLETENKLKTSLATQQKQKKRFAYALSGLIILGTGYGVFRYRKYNRQKAEQRRLKERLAISQDLHDHVGSTLSSISVYSKVAQVEGEKGNAEKMNELLDKVRNTSSKMITEMNDIVWAINPQNDTMEKIIQRMESFARPLLAARNMQFHFNYDEEVKSLNLEMEQRKNFYLIFKEAVNNAIKYSGGNLLEAAIKYQQGLLELLVSDNGVGFNMEKEMNETRSLSGNGLKNMKARAAVMNANMAIESSAGKGTKIRLVCPFI